MTSICYILQHRETKEYLADIKVTGPVYVKNACDAKTFDFASTARYVAFYDKNLSILRVTLERIS